MGEEQCLRWASHGDMDSTSDDEDLGGEEACEPDLKISVGPGLRGSDDRGQKGTG